MEERVFITNKKGLKLAGNIHYPNKDKKYPAVILLHGNTGWKDEEHIKVLAEDLAKNGFVAIRYDTSGFGESDGTLWNDYRFTNSLSDVNDVLAYTMKLPYIDSDKIGLWGHSAGGQLTVIAGAPNPVFKALCVVSGASKMRREGPIDKEVEWKKNGYITKVNKSKMGLLKIPYAYYEDRLPYDALEFLKDTHKPILVIAGLKDTTVSAKHTKEIFTHANEPKKYIEFADMDHKYLNYPEKIKEVNECVIEFFKNYL